MSKQDNLDDIDGILDVLSTSRLCEGCESGGKCLQMKEDNREANGGDKMANARKAAWARYRKKQMSGETVERYCVWRDTYIYRERKSTSAPVRKRKASSIASSPR